MIMVFASRLQEKTAENRDALCAILDESLFFLPVSRQ